MAGSQPRGYRQSYVEKDRHVRNSTAIQIPGVDVLQGFTLPKHEFEDLCLQTATDLDTRSPLCSLNTPTCKTSSRKAQESSSPTRAFRGEGPESAEPTDAEGAGEYADICRRHAAGLQRVSPPDYEGAGEYFEKAVDARAKNGLFCTQENAEAHVEYAQNLSKRGLTPEAEYHLRCAADVYRMLGARGARKYGDVLLYMAVVIDRQGRLQEAENFYRSALAVYRRNKLSDDNVRVGIDSLSNNLRAQGRGAEVERVVRRHFLGALD